MQGAHISGTSGSDFREVFTSPAEAMSPSEGPPLMRQLGNRARMGSEEFGDQRPVPDSVTQVPLQQNSQIPRWFFLTAALPWPSRPGSSVVLLAGYLAPGT